MKYFYILSMSFYAWVLAVNTPGATFLYMSRDLCLGLRQEGGSSEMVVNLGRASRFYNAAPNSKIVFTEFTLGQLTNTFFSLNRLHWSVFGASRLGDGGEATVPANTLWVTRMRSARDQQTTPWIRLNNTSHGQASARINSVGSNAAKYSNTLPPGANNTPTAVVMPADYRDTYSAYVKPSGSFQNSFQGDVEALTPSDFSGGASFSLVDLYELRPDTGAMPYQKPGKYLGVFELSPDGQLSFTAASGSAPNQMPTLSSISNQSLTENTSSQPLRFTIGDAETPLDQLQLIIESSNPALLPPPPITAGGAANERQIILSPAQNQKGTATITLSVTDGAGQTAKTSFVVEVLAKPVDQFPVIGNLANLVLLEDQPSSPVLIEVSDQETAIEQLKVIIESSNPALIPVPVAEAGANPNQRQMVLTPSANQHGSARITITVQDSAGQTISKFFEVEVTPVNDPPVLRAPSDQVINELQSLQLTLVAEDVDNPISQLTFSLQGAAPQNLLLTPSGELTWTPDESQGPSSNRITVQVTDQGTPPLTATQSFTVVVREINVPPQMVPIGPQTINPLVPLILNVQASDSDVPANPLTFLLRSGPVGAVLDPNTGRLAWTPSLEQSPSTNLVVLEVADQGEPPLSVTQSFEIVVTAGRVAPVIHPQADQQVVEMTSLLFTNQVTGGGLPGDSIVFELVSGPEGMTLESASGVLSWTPSEMQGPGTNLVRLRAFNSQDPSLAATSEMTIIVLETNRPPILLMPADQIMDEMTTLVLTNQCSDADWPPQAIRYQLIAGPEGAQVDSVTGIFTWTPAEAQGPSTHTVTVRALDSGEPALETVQSFRVVVGEVNRAPNLSPFADQRISPGANLDLAGAALDEDQPINQLTFSLDASPQGAVIDPVSGQISWTPHGSQQGQIHRFEVRVTDDGVPPLSATQSFLVEVSREEIIPVICHLSRAGSDRVTLSWNIQSGRSYRLQFTESLRDGIWQDIQEEAISNGATATLIQDAKASRRFYRVSSIPQP